jgi:chorismate-pyruvate lyase
MNPDLFDTLKAMEIPTALRICAGTDGSVTYLLELLTRSTVNVVTQCQVVQEATHKEATLLMIKIGDPVNHRQVLLMADDVPYVCARSLTPIDPLPLKIKDDLMQADIPIGRILRTYKLETRRDIQKIETLKGSGIFRGLPVISREYFIIHGGNILMWINEQFPIDERWEL